MGPVYTDKRGRFPRSPSIDREALGPYKIPDTTLYVRFVPRRTWVTRVGTPVNVSGLTNPDCDSVPGSPVGPVCLPVTGHLVPLFP